MGSGNIDSSHELYVGSERAKLYVGTSIYGIHSVCVHTVVGAIFSSSRNMSGIMSFCEVKTDRLILPRVGFSPWASSGITM